MPLPPSRYRWNATAARYVDARGRFVPRELVRRELDDALAAAKQRMAGISEAFRTGGISSNDWFAEMRQLVKQVQLYSATAAKGGWAQMSPADFGRVGGIVREQYGFLLNFANQIAAGLPLDGRFLRRVAMYAESGRRTFHRTETAEMTTRGLDEERSILHPADHCTDCVVEADKGWQPIGSLIPIGERECLGGCKCTMEFRRAA
jgi:hypothetical protein